MARRGLTVTSKVLAVVHDVPQSEHIISEGNAGHESASDGSGGIEKRAAWRIQYSPIIGTLRQCHVKSWKREVMLNRSMLVMTTRYQQLFPISVRIIIEYDVLCVLLWLLTGQASAALSKSFGLNWLEVVTRKGPGSLCFDNV